MLRHRVIGWENKVLLYWNVLEKGPFQNSSKSSSRNGKRVFCFDFRHGKSRGPKIPNSFPEYSSILAFFPAIPHPPCGFKAGPNLSSTSHSPKFSNSALWPISKWNFTFCSWTLCSGYPSVQDKHLKYNTTSQILFWCVLFCSFFFLVFQTP